MEKPPATPRGKGRSGSGEELSLSADFPQRAQRELFGKEQGDGSELTAGMGWGGLGAAWLQLGPPSSIVPKQLWRKRRAQGARTSPEHPARDLGAPTKVTHLPLWGAVGPPPALPLMI